MKINYIISNSTKGATTAALKNIANIASNDILTNYVVIVPETKSIIIEKELLALSNTGAYVNVFVYSFVRLLNRLNFVKKEKSTNCGFLNLIKNSANSSWVKFNVTNVCYSC